MPYIIGTLLALVIILIVLLIRSIWRRYKDKDKHERENAEHATRQAEYDRFYGEIQAKKEIEKDKASRRRITQKDRATVLARDNCTCAICGISKSFLDSLCEGLGDYLLFEIDHIVSVQQGGTGGDLDNLQTLCWRCNRKKGGKKTNDDVRAMIDYGIDKLMQQRDDGDDKNARP